ncbi:hypothetical protein L0152_04820 [bacterium]|nr:hypothetical protein [bacterium]
MRRSFLAVLCMAALASAGPLPVKRTTFVSPTPATFNVGPNMAINTRNNEALAVWDRHPGNHPDHRTWGRLVNPKGEPLGATFQIVPGFNPYNPFVAHNPVRNEYALAYANESNAQSRFMVYVQRLNIKGMPSGAAIRVSQESGTHDLPQILFHEPSGNYILFWNRFSDEDAGLYGAILNPNTLATIHGPVLIQLSPREGGLFRTPVVSTLAVQPQTGRIALAYSQLAPGVSTSTQPQSNLYLASLDPGLSGVTPSNFVKVNPRPVWSSDFDFKFLPDGTGIAAFTDGSGMRIRKINQNLKPSGPMMPAFRPPLNNRQLLYPRIAYSRNMGVLLAIEDPFGTAATGPVIWAQTLNETGQPQQNPFTLEKPQDRATQPVLIPLHTPANSPQHQFAVVYVLGVQRNIPPTQEESSSLVLLSFGFTED